jgi:hypothetical protein
MRAEFVAAWEHRLREEQPGFIAIFRRAVEAGFSDGRDGISGRTEIGDRLDRVKVANGTQSAGFVEGVEQGFVHGWAVDRVRAATGGRCWQPASIWLIIDGIPICEAAATLGRPDVAAAGYTEMAGFRIAIPPSLCDGTKRHIEVRSAASGLRIPFLADAPDRTRGVRLFGADIGEAPPDYHGDIEAIENGAVRGRVIDRNAKERPVWIDLEINGTRLPTIVAGRSGSGPGTGTPDDGGHAYRVALPKRLLTRSSNPAWSSIEVVMFAGGTNHVIARKSLAQHGDGFSPDFSPDDYLSWAFVHDPMPIGTYDQALQLQTFLATNERRLAAQARDSQSDALVSVIMPAFNRASVIGSAIRSVLDQTYRNWELLIVDDGSRDRTVEVVEALMCQVDDSRIRLLRHDRNRGASAARNTALREARGSYVAYLDTDNAWYPTYLAIMVDQMERSAEAMAAYAGLEVWEHLPVFCETELRYIRCNPFNRSRLEGGNFIDMNVFFHRRCAVAEFGAFREDMRRFIDWELILRYTSRQPPLFVPALLGRYYINVVANQISSTEDFGSHVSMIRQDVKRQQGWRRQA